MDAYSRRLMSAMLVLFVLVMYVMFGVTFIEIKEVNEYPLEKIMEGETPIYVTHRELGYYFQYEKDGRSVAEFIPNESVKDNRTYMFENVVPRVRYNYVVGVYRLNYPGGFIDAKAPPQLSSVQFLVPNGTIAEF